MTLHQDLDRLHDIEHRLLAQQAAIQHAVTACESALSGIERTLVDVHVAQASIERQRSVLIDEVLTNIIGSTRWDEILSPDPTTDAFLDGLQHPLDAEMSTES